MAQYQGWSGLTNGRVDRAVLLDHNGKEILPNRHDWHRDPNDQYEERDDGFALTHHLTFGSIYRGAAYTYNMLWDEAQKHSHKNALAMRRDAWLMALLRERADETLTKKWHLEVDNAKDPWQKTVCDGLTKIVKGIHRFNRMRRYLLQGALWYGRYGANLKWAWRDMYLPVMQTKGPAGAGGTSTPTLAIGRVLTVIKHKPVNGDKINFAYDDTPYVLINGAFHDKLKGHPDIIYPTGAGAAACLLRGTWREQILIHESDPDDADYFESELAAGIHGVGIRSRIYWLDFLRRDYFGAVTEMLNRIGLGLVVIYYESGNADAEAKAKLIAKKYSRRAVITMPRSPDLSTQSGGIEVIETPMAGAAIMLDLQRHVEDQIERYMVGQTVSGGGGSSNPMEGSGRSEFAKETKSQICLGDAWDFDETMTGSPDHFGIVETIKKWTYSYADFPVRYVTDTDPQDNNKTIENVCALVEVGVDFDADSVRALTGQEKPAPGAPTIGGKEELQAQRDAETAQLQANLGDQGGGDGGDKRFDDAGKGDEDHDLSYRDESPVIPYHADAELSVHEIVRRIRILGTGPASREYTRYLRQLLLKNPHLQKELPTEDAALLQALGMDK